jgi:septum formation protein
MTKLILASGSPYRRQMLERLGLPFAVAAADIDESPNPGESGAELAQRLAIAKAGHVAGQHPGAVVIGSDQVAECRGRLLGKPGTVENACAQLAFCSGQTMQFHSAVAVSAGDHMRHRLVTTRVRLRVLDPSQIRQYVTRDQPLDCAGAMRSESLGVALAEEILSDDPSALIGLPLIATIDLLGEFGIDPLG